MVGLNSFLLMTMVVETQAHGTKTGKEKANVRDGCAREITKEVSFDEVLVVVELLLLADHLGN